MMPDDRSTCSATGWLVPPCRAARRPTGFTLVELLVVISIIAILSGLVMFASFSAQEAAREMKTEAMILKLHNIVMPFYESYSSRRVPIKVPANATRRQAAIMRLDGLRELMRMELPERWSDVVDLPVVPGLRRPAVSRAYFRRHQALGPNTRYQSAECLYLVVTVGLAGDVGGREMFNERDIGDLDGDGMPEFLDGWGNPIFFLRWAPGFASELQPAPDLDNDGIADAIEFLDPDPFDPLGVDSTTAAPTYALYPLIYSAGPDGIFDIVANDDDPPVYSVENNDPYFTVHVSGGNWPNGGLGAPANLDSYKFGQTVPADPGPNGQLDHTDNIHNHLIGTN